MKKIHAENGCCGAWEVHQDGVSRTCADCKESMNPLPAPTKVFKTDFCRLADSIEVSKDDYPSDYTTVEITAGLSRKVAAALREANQFQTALEAICKRYCNICEFFNCEETGCRDPATHTPKDYWCGPCTARAALEGKW